MIKCENDEVKVAGIGYDLLAEYSLITKGMFDTLMKTKKATPAQIKLLLLEAFKIGTEKL